MSRNGGVLRLRLRRWHANIKAAMRRVGARMGGEFSGHYYWRELHNFDSALLTFVYVLNLVSQSEKPFSELLQPYEKYFHSGELNFQADPNMIERLKSEYADGRQSTVDGLVVEYDDWWFVARPSKTEPLVRLAVEAETREKLEEKVAELNAILQKR